MIKQQNCCPSIKYIPENDCEKLIQNIPRKEGNQSCADCGYPSPSWASLDFGILICYECSGIHRKMGPTISRVRSLQLDKWTIENLQMLWNVGNEKANFYWESMLSKQAKKEMTSSETEKIDFIYSKYLKKAYIMGETKDPVSEYLRNKENKNNLEEQKKLKILVPNQIYPQKAEKRPIPKIRNLTPEPPKTSFDWNQATQILALNKSEEKSNWLNFNQESFNNPLDKTPKNKKEAMEERTREKKPSFFKNQPKCLSPENELKKPRDQKIVSKEQKMIGGNDFNAVSSDLRNFLLTGNPLENLKTCENN